MNLSNSSNFKKATKVFFFISLLMIVFSFIDLFLRKFEDIQITINYQWIWLLVILITLLFLGILKKWKRFFLIMFFGFSVILLHLYYFMLSPLSVAKNIENSRYELLAASNHYKIYEKHDFYKVLVASKTSKIFFEPNVKTGLNDDFTINKISETPGIIVLEIKMQQTVNDTIQKLQH